MRLGSGLSAASGRLAAQVHEVAAKGFEVNIDAYERARPSYPEGAVRAVAAGLCARGGQGAPLKVLEIGAGTGKFTRRLLGELAGRAGPGGVSLTAVEPAAAMRAAFAAAVVDAPGVVPDGAEVSVEAGAADALPAADGSVDLVVVAQAFHWFANEEVVAEMARVLAPGGRLALVWNMEDRTAPWVASLRDAYEVYEGSAPQYRQGKWKQVWTTATAKEAFAPLAHVQVAWSMPADLKTIWERIKSKSYISLLDDARREALQAKVTALALEAHPQLAEQAGASVAYPYHTDGYITHKL